MLFRPLLAAAGLTAAANAFLLPPQLSTHEVEAIESVPVESLHIAQTQSIRLDCPGCPPVFKKSNGKPKHHKPHSSHLELDFTVDNAAESNRLLVNGFELYPNSDPFTSVLMAPQVVDKPKHHKQHHEDDDTKALKSHHKFRPHEGRPKAVEQQLGFSLQIQPTNAITEEGMDIIVVDLQVIEVGSVFVDGLSNIRVHLIKLPDNKLLIGKIEQTASENDAMSKGDSQECTTLVCKWRAIIAAQLAKMKMHGCAGMMGIKGAHGHAGPNNHKHHGHHPGHMTQQRQHGWSQLFRKLTSHIILPILVGIVAGVSVSIIGMVIGTILVGVWRKFVRGQSFFPSHQCRRLRLSGTRHHHHKAHHGETAVMEEKTALMAGQEVEEELPPSYEDGIEVNHVERV